MKMGKKIVFLKFIFIAVFLSNLTFIIRYGEAHEESEMLEGQMKDEPISVYHYDVEAKVIPKRCKLEVK